MLALLLSHFVIELSDKPVVWNISGIRFPTVGVDGTKPELPLKVSLYRPGANPAGAASPQQSQSQHQCPPASVLPPSGPAVAAQ